MSVILEMNSSSPVTANSIAQTRSENPSSPIINGRIFSRSLASPINCLANTQGSSPAMATAAFILSTRTEATSSNESRPLWMIPARSDKDDSATSLFSSSRCPLKSHQEGTSENRGGRADKRSAMIAPRIWTDISSLDCDPSSISGRKSFFISAAAEERTFLTASLRSSGDFLASHSTIAARTLASPIAVSHRFRIAPQTFNLKGLRRPREYSTEPSMRPASPQCSRANATVSSFEKLTIAASFALNFRWLTVAFEKRIQSSSWGAK